MNVQISKDQKILDSIISHIEHFEQVHWYKTATNFPILDSLPTKFWKENEEFKSEFALNNLLNQQQCLEIMYSRSISMVLKGGLYDIILGIAPFQQLSMNVALGYGYTSFEGITKHFTTNFSDPIKPEKYMGLVKCSDEHSRSDNFLGGYFLPSCDLKIGKVTYGSRLLQLRIHGISIECYLYEKENTKNKYFFIEATTPVHVEHFKKILNELLLVLNFLTGYALGSEFYTLINTGVDNKRWDEHRIVSYDHFAEKLTSSGFAAIPQISDHIAEHNVLQINKGAAFFTTMIEACISTSAFRRTLLLMAQATTQPDYIRVVQYAVALESMVKIFKDNNESKINPITDKSLAKELRAALKAELERFGDRLSAGSLDKLRNYVDRINSPTNADMLTKPFELLGIRLSEPDLEAIKKRNDFLHGRLPADSGSHELSIIGHRLQFCVNALVLKHLGYEGAVWYHVTHYQRHHHILEEDALFRMI